MSRFKESENLSLRPRPGESAEDVLARVEGELARRHLAARRGRIIAVVEALRVERNEARRKKSLEIFGHPGASVGSEFAPPTYIEVIDLVLEEIDRG